MKPYICKRLLEGLALALALTSITVFAAPDLSKLPTHRNPISMAALERPPLHDSVAEPVYGTRIRRITDATQVWGVSRLRHYYSKRNPFNADLSLAIMMASDGNHWLFDAQDWKPIKKLPVSPKAEVHWHPDNADMAFVLDYGSSSGLSRMYWLNLRTGEGRVLLDLEKYGFKNASGKMEGNPDKKMTVYAVAGETTHDKTSMALVDIQDGKVLASRRIDPAWVRDWISVSPSGKFIVTMGKTRSRIFDRKLHLIHELPKGSHGHGDLCLAEDGREALVFDGADLTLNGKRNINIAWLDTGKVDIGTRIGWSATPHVSCRNMKFPGWALISTQGKGRRSDYPNLDSEIFWLKLDGSGEIRRVAHHRSSREKGGYFAEQHATSDPTGRWILFASNWQDDEIDSFLIELPKKQ